MKADYLIYIASLVLFGCTVLASGYWIMKISPDNLEQREKLPRNVGIGIILAIAGLIWCIPQSEPVLPDSMHKFLIPLAVICAFLAYNFLDYLFARSLGGLAILLAHYFLHESFTRHTPAAPIFAAFCFAMGIIGIFFAGKPYLLRDYIRKAAASNRFRIAGASFCYVFGIFCLVLGILQLTMRR